MTGVELLLQIVLAWNRLRKPATEQDVERLIEDLCRRYGGRVIQTAGEGYGKYSEILEDFDDADQHLVGRLVREVGERLQVRFLRFIAHFTEGLVQLDYENNPPASLASYSKAANLWFDKLSEQLYCGNRGLAHSHLEQWDESIRWLQRALELAEDRGDQESIGIYNQNMGVAFRFKGDLYAALECYERAYEISCEIDDSFKDRREKNLEAIKEDIAKYERGETPRSIVITGEEERTLPKVLRYSRPLRVFLSHASEDKNAVKALATKIADERFDVWLDEENILPGAEWDSTITYTLERSDAVIVCLTPRLINKQTYIKQEIRLAARLATEQQKLLVPLILDNCPLPPELSAYQAVDYRRDDGHRKLMAALDDRAKMVGIQ